MNNIDRVLEYQALVGSIINKCAFGYDREDLFQVGMKGLIKANGMFDETRGVKFSTYAYLHILGEITNYIRENRTIKLSRSTISEYRTIIKEREVLTQRLGRFPTNLELSLYLDIDLKHLEEVEIEQNPILSLDAMISGEEDDSNLYGAVKICERGYDDNIIDLNTSLERLSQEERQLIKSRYFDEKSQTEVSKELGISQAKVSRHEQKILVKMRNDLTVR